MTKVCIFGAGSIGGYIAACLKKTDVDVSLVARGPHKEAIEKNGLTFIKNEKVENYKIREEPNVFVEGLKKRGLEIDIDKILQIDKDLRISISDIQTLQEQRNQISKDAGKAKSFSTNKRR